LREIGGSRFSVIDVQKNNFTGEYLCSPLRESFMSLMVGADRRVVSALCEVIYLKVYRKNLNLKITRWGKPEQSPFLSFTKVENAIDIVF